MALHLVTGGSGFVGSNIVRMLLERNESVRVIDIWRDDSMPLQVEFIVGDITNRDAVRQAMCGVEYVHHTVALQPLSKAGRGFWTVNVDGTQVALEEAARANVRMFCHLSSTALFGRTTAMPITVATPPMPLDEYGRSKLAAEHCVQRAAQAGLPVSIVRPRTIVGPGRLGTFHILFDWIRDNANVIVIGSGDHLYQFAHVNDIAEICIRSCLQEQRGTFHVGAEEFGTLRADLTALIRHAGSTSHIRSVPVWLAQSTLMALDKLHLSPLGPWHYLTYHKPCYMDIEPTKTALGWVPRYTNLDILKSAYDWFISQPSTSMAPGMVSFHKAPVKQGVLRLVKWLA